MRPLTTLLALLAFPTAYATAQVMQWEQSGYQSVSCDLSVDVDGDGLPDAIIGDYRAGVGGVVTVRSGVTGALIHTIQGPAGEKHGENVVGLGDLNGDGHAEFGFSGNLIELEVRNGLTGMPLGFSVDGANMPKSFATIGDVNGDGYDDIVIGRPNDGSGVVKVMSGRFYFDGTLPAKLWSLKSGQAANGQLGTDVITIADITGDGVEEVIFSAPGENGVTSSGSAYHGQVYCVSGADGSIIWARKHLTAASPYFGGSLANIGDFNGDGIDDIAVGAPYNSEKGFLAGAIYIMKGNNSGTLAEYRSSLPGEEMGSDVAGVGDLDQDGTPDILVGAQYYDNGFGMARIFSGASMTLSGSTVDVIWSAVGTGFLGAPGSLSGGVDASGDGLPDFLAAAPAGGVTHSFVQLWRAECVGGDVSYCNSTANSSGKHAILSTSGSLSISANTLVLEARKCPSQVLGVFFYGTAANQVPFGDGNLCIGGTVTRILPGVATSANGSASLALDFDAAPLGAGPHAVAPGDTRYFQYWFRDPAVVGGTGFNLTDGRELTFCP